MSIIPVEGAVFFEMPLSPALAPRVPCGARESGSAATLAEERFSAHRAMRLCRRLLTLFMLLMELHG
jgi:hypothetical protein